MNKLDNPIWHALTSQHSHLALGTGPVRRYPSEIAPFVGLEDSSDSSTGALNSLVKSEERVGILSVHPTSLDGWIVQKCFGIAQFVWENTPGTVQPDSDAVVLGPEHLQAMLDLTALVYPAYFRKGTAELGDYFGIIEDGKLCAMAGIRFALDGYQEISAVCTHPDYRGKGLASRLSLHVVNHIESQGNVPFLHTEADNTAAQSVYNRIGFTMRKMLPFLVLVRS